MKAKWKFTGSGEPFAKITVQYRVDLDALEKEISVMLEDGKAPGTRKQVEKEIRKRIEGNGLQFYDYGFNDQGYNILPEAKELAAQLFPDFIKRILK